MADLREELEAALAGRYAVERELGHGGMAYVFLARDLRHDREVAIKVLKPDLATSIGVERFLREIRITARLEHPNIVRLYASDTIGSTMMYYVVQYVPGETLQRKLQREAQLPIDEAIAITRQVATALDYAHEHGVVHRDIKPANVLLHGDQVVVADFGLARMYDATEAGSLTQSSTVMGTPAYMSPEQVSGDTELDGRTDIYSLACVFFEMVAGREPFHATTRQGYYGQHLTAERPSLCAERSNCPPEIDTAVRRAMSIVPADRFRTATDFVRALEGEVVSTPGSRRGSPATGVAAAGGRRWIRIVGASAAVLAFAAAGMYAVRKQQGAMAATALDASTYLVLPVDGGGSRIDTTAVAERLVEALGEWDGVRIVDDRSTDERLSAIGTKSLRLTDATRIAREARAAHLVWGTSAREGDSIVVRASMYDAGTGTLVRSHSISFLPSSRPPIDRFRELANALLRDRDESPWAASAPRSRQSLAAWLAYDEGRAAAARWAIDTAEGKFREALGADPAHPLAHLWLARMLIWSGQPRDAWRAAAKRAFELRDQLPERDGIAAEAQVALADGRYPTACEKYARIVALDTSDIAGWFGLGECVVRDSVVVADRSSASGFAFRSSWQRAVDAYLHIIEEMPGPHPEFVYLRLQKVLYTEANKLRVGHGVNGAPMYYAYASRQADTLAFVPYSSIGKASSQRSATPRSLLDAMERNRAILSGVYRAWVREVPGSLNARLALAGWLESSGEVTSEVPDRPSALSQIRVARSLATDSIQRIALAAAEVRLHLKSGEWSIASRLADSVFRAAPQPAGKASKPLIGLAALTGRLRRTADMFLVDSGGFDVTLPAGGQAGLSPVLRREVARMRAYASLGVCDDSVRTFSSRVERLLESTYNDPQLRITARDALLRRPLSLTAPCQGARPLVGVADGGDRLVVALQALAQGNRAAVGAQFDSIRVARASSRPGDVAMEYTYLEAWLRTQVNDTAGAVRQLDRSLEALPTLGIFLVDMPSQAAGLVRAMALRAELAHALGDAPNASRWANAVATLWANADPELQPVVARMRNIAGSH